MFPSSSGFFPLPALLLLEIVNRINGIRPYAGRMPMAGVVSLSRTNRPPADSCAHPSAAATPPSFPEGCPAAGLNGIQRD